LDIGIRVESDENRLGPQPDTEAIQHRAFDSRRQSQHVACRRPAAVDERKRMLAGNADGTVGSTTLEP
jgi:hypothetical protein